MRRGRCCCLKTGACPPPETDLWLSGYSTNSHGGIVYDEIDPIPFKFHWTESNSGWAAVVPIPADSGLQTSDLPGCAGTLGAGTLNCVASLFTNYPYTGDAFTLRFYFGWLQRIYGGTPYPDPGAPPIVYTPPTPYGDPYGFPTLPWSFDWTTRLSCWSSRFIGGYAGFYSPTTLIVDSCRPFVAHTDDSTPIRLRTPWNGHTYLNFAISEDGP